MKDPIEITVEILTETDAAYRVTDTDDLDSNIWVPKSQIELLHPAGVGDIVTIEMPEWLALDKGFI
jgi:hypothetical protein